MRISTEFYNQFPKESEAYGTISALQEKVYDFMYLYEKFIIKIENEVFNELGKVLTNQLSKEEAFNNALRSIAPEVRLLPVFKRLIDELEKVEKEMGPFQGFDSP